MERRRNFTDAYAYGRIAESQIAQWLMQAQGWNLLPAYEIEIPSGKGPRLLTPVRKLIAPDLLAMKYQRRRLLVKWYEAKHKTHFTWHRKSNNWQTGIDLRHYLDYIKVQDATQEVYICFLHECAMPSAGDLAYGSPSVCPTGLYGGSLEYLMAHEHHRDSFERAGRGYPMVYWNESDLDHLASLDEVRTLPVSLWKAEKDWDFRVPAEDKQP